MRMPGDWWPYALAVFAGFVLLRRGIPLVACARAAFGELGAATDEPPINYRLWQLVAMIIAAYTAGRPCRAGAARPPRPRPGGVRRALVLASPALVYWQVDPDRPDGARSSSASRPTPRRGHGAADRRIAETAAVRASIREQRAREAIMEERVRIARELHDMVAHSVTVMVIQAGVVAPPARRRAARGSAAAARHGVLRPGRGAASCGGRWDCCAARAATRRGAGRAGPARRADRAGAGGGLRSRCASGSPSPLLPAADLSAYRIVQEALTNVLKHAGTGPYRRGALPPGRRAPRRHRRAAPHGGARAQTGRRSGPDRHARAGDAVRRRADAGPRPEGGFAVRARLPLLVAP